MNTSDFDYPLPPETIAQTPVEPRDASRLLALRRADGALEHAIFSDIGRYLQAGDLLVLNETRVIPARLFGRKIPSGGRVEVLLLRRESADTWEALVGGKGLAPGKWLQIENGPPAEIVALLEGPRRLVRFAEPIEGFLPAAGHTPLPPYIHEKLADPERYQTVYARQPGSAAAPTAGLHFTPRLLESLSAQGVLTATVTLHVGLDTFAPVTESDPQTHRIHSEWREVSAHTAQMVNAARQAGKRVVAVGTTSVRTLESAFDPASGALQPVTGPTSLYILPGYRFAVVDALITNFHLPKSTLIMLVSAFAGREQVLAAYAAAIRQGYRFYSFGDAMLII